MLRPHEVQLPLECSPHRIGQQRHPVPIALATSDDDLVAPEVNVLATQAAALHQAQPGTVQQCRHEPWRATQVIENLLDFLACQDSRQALSNAWGSRS
jgi:hypothetical protein